MNSKLDIYFRKIYGQLYEEQNKSILKEYRYSSKEGEILYIFLKREILNQNLREKYYDVITPYGYGGPLIIDYSKKTVDKLVEGFDSNFSDYCNENNIVSEFIRFHPLEKNHIHFSYVYDISLNRKTIYIDLTDEEIIWSNMKSTSRNRIRKSQQNNINVVEDSSNESLSKFIELYYETMDKNSADSMYYFDKSYFCKLLDGKSNFSKIFNAVYEGKTISSIIILIGNEYIHYHLGATEPKYYSLSPNNILFYEVAKWACREGYIKFHLGGGYTGANDNLFRFKKTLNQKGEIEFYLGKKIRNKRIYDELVHERMKLGELNRVYFPLYRSPLLEKESIQ